MQFVARHSRRALIRAGFATAGSVLVAACAPTTSLTPARTTRAGEPPSSVAPVQSDRTADGATPSTLSLATPTPRPAEFRVTPTRQSVIRSSSRTLGALGREYRAYPEISGTVQFAHAWDGPRGALVEGWVAEMAAVYPSIKVESEVGEPALARERLVTALASGLPPNAVMLKSDSLAYFAERGALLPLDDLLARDGITNDWFGPTEMASRTWNGHVVGLPQSTDGAQHLLFVNLGLLERIGSDPNRPIRTWQDLDALVEPAVNAGLFVMDPGRMPVGTTAHQVWTYANGGRYWDAEMKTIVWSAAAGVEAAEWLLQFVKDQAGRYERLASGGDSRTPLSAAEWAGEQYLCAVNGAGWFFQLQQEGQRVRYAAYELPRNPSRPDSHGESPTTGGWSLAIPAASRDQEAAWEWLKLTTVSESACTFAERQRRPSPLAGCDDRAGLETTHPFWPAVRASLTRSVPVPTTPIQPHLEQIYRQMQAEVFLERRAPADALQGAARDAQQLLDEWHSARKRS